MCEVLAANATLHGKALDALRAGGRASAARPADATVAACLALFTVAGVLLLLLLLRPAGGGLGLFAFGSPLAEPPPPRMRLFGIELPF